MASVQDTISYRAAALFRVTFPQKHLVRIELNHLSGWGDNLVTLCQESGLIFKNVSRDSAVRAIIIVLGYASSSSNIGMIQSVAHGRENEAQNAIHTMRTREFIDTLKRCTKPVICISQGVCTGLALEIASACDMRICTSNSIFCTKPCSDVGGVAGYGALLSVLRIVGNSSWMSEVGLSGRMFTSEEALRAGFVSSVWGSIFEAHNEGMRLAMLMGKRSPTAVLMAKEAILHCGNFNSRYVQKLESDYIAEEAGADLDRALGVGSLKFESDYTAEEAEADLDRALGAGGLKWQSDYTAEEAAADLDRALGVGSLKWSEKLERL